MLYTYYLMADDFRINEEKSTQRRARLLGFEYVDSSLINPKTLYHNILTPEEMRSLRAVPLRADQYKYLFGIVTTTPQTSL